MSEVSLRCFEWCARNLRVYGTRVEKPGVCFMVLGSDEHFRESEEAVFDFIVCP